MVFFVLSSLVLLLKVDPAPNPQSCFPLCQLDLHFLSGRGLASASCPESLLFDSGSARFRDYSGVRFRELGNF